MTLKDTLKFWTFSRPWRPGTRVLSLGSWSWLKAEYCNRYGLTPIHRDARALLDRKTLDVSELLLSEVRKPWTRWVAQRYRDAEIPVIGFEHGNTFGMRLIPEWTDAYAHCDRFVIATQGSLENFRASGPGMWYVFLDTDHYERIWRKNQKAPTCKNPRRIMLMNFPMLDIQRHTHIPAHTVKAHLDLERRIGDLLMRCGYEVTSKVHPATARHPEYMDQLIGHRKETRPFEKVYLNTDAYLFPQIESSTFGLALLTNKPIIVMDLKGRLWAGRTKELLDRRCRNVPMWVEGDSLQFDPVRLLQATGAAYGDTDRNTDFVEAYANVHTDV